MTIEVDFISIDGEFTFEEFEQNVRIMCFEIMIGDVLRISAFSRDCQKHKRNGGFIWDWPRNIECENISDPHLSLLLTGLFNHWRLRLELPLISSLITSIPYRIACLQSIQNNGEQTQHLIVDIIMINIEIVQNTFDKSALKKLMEILRMVNFNLPRNKIAEELQELSPKTYLWAIGTNPAYFVQYQVKSAAIFRVRDNILIAWKPKFIQYPSMVVFPEVGEKTLNNMKMELDNQSTTTQYTNKTLLQFLGKFYGSYFHSDPQFQTNLVTFAKHFVSKVSKHSYWHVLLQDTGKLFTTQLSEADSIVKVRISGIKEGYDKTLLLFSFKGQREGIFGTAKNKWMQVVSFLAMIVIFYSTVACSGDPAEAQGICQYRSEMTLGGAGMMLALLGLRYGQKATKKKKSAPTNERQKTE